METVSIAYFVKYPFLINKKYILRQNTFCSVTDKGNLTNSVHFVE